jgi:hypothetical protein
MPPLNDQLPLPQDWAGYPLGGGLGGEGLGRPLQRKSRNYTGT